MGEDPLLLVATTRGQRRHLVTLQLGTPSEEPNAEGGYDVAWTNLVPPHMWAAISGPPGPQEAVAGNVERASISHEVEIDYHPQLTLKCRVVFGSRYLYVVGLENVDERNVTHVISAEERA